jgi:hypothetical protein
MATFCPSKKSQGTLHMLRNVFLPFLTLPMIAGPFVTPAVCQNRFADEAREQAQRRAENKAVREVEQPEATQTAKATQAPAAPAAPAAAAPAAPAAPVAAAAPAAPAATPAQ